MAVCLYRETEDGLAHSLTSATPHGFPRGTPGLGSKSQRGLVPLTIPLLQPSVLRAGVFSDCP